MVDSSVGRNVEESNEKGTKAPDAQQSQVWGRVTTLSVVSSHVSVSDTARCDVMQMGLVGGYLIKMAAMSFSQAPGSYYAIMHPWATKCCPVIWCDVMGLVQLGWWIFDQNGSNVFLPSPWLLLCMGIGQHRAAPVTKTEKVYCGQRSTGLGHLLHKTL